MFDASIVFIVQAIFMFFIDHKYRFLSDGTLNKLLIFQGMISVMYVFVIPMIAKGESASSIAYILGSVVGTYISYIINKRSKGLSND